MNVLVIFVSLIAVWPFSSGKEYTLTAAASVPAATGTVKVQKDKDNGNMKLDIKVEHLANPSSLTPPANSYIVWIRPADGAPIKQGAIRVNSNLEGQLKTVTVSKDFDLLITAEQTATVSVPSKVEVLRAHVSPN